FVDRLQQIVDGLDVERTDRVLVVRGHEDHDWPVNGYGFAKDLEAVEPGHLYIEENEVRPLLIDGDNGRAAIAGFTDDLDLRFLREHREQSPTRERFVVDDERANSFGHPTGCATGASPARNGMSTVTRVPEGRRPLTSTLCSVP